MNNYPFWRFMQIFFHSGARITELLQIQKKHVDLKNQKFLVIIKKKKQKEEVYKPIKNIAFTFWEEIVQLAKNQNDFLFSKGLLPNTYSINSAQITRRWRVHIKSKLGISADLYSLKHLNLDEVSATLSLQDAAKLANHNSIKTTKSFYALNEEERQFQRLREIENKF